MNCYGPMFRNIFTAFNYWIHSQFTLSRKRTHTHTRFGLITVVHKLFKWAVKILILYMMIVFKDLRLFCLIRRLSHSCGITLVFHVFIKITIANYHNKHCARECVSTLQPLLQNYSICLSPSLSMLLVSPPSPLMLPSPRVTWLSCLRHSLDMCFFSVIPRIVLSSSTFSRLWTVFKEKSLVSPDYVFLQEFRRGIHLLIFMESFLEYVGPTSVSFPVG